VAPNEVGVIGETFEVDQRGRWLENVFSPESILLNTVSQGCPELVRTSVTNSFSSRQHRAFTMPTGATGPGGQGANKAESANLVLILRNSCISTAQGHLYFVEMTVSSQPIAAFTSVLLRAPAWVRCLIGNTLSGSPYSMMNLGTYERLKATRTIGG
jgi:hypothetical protein